MATATASAEPPTTGADHSLTENDSKRSKVCTVEESPIYPPSTIPFPQQFVLAEYHRAALEAPTTTTGGDPNDSNSYHQHHQQRLDQFGLLSFEDVLLPAAAYEHEQVLKRYQAVVQRDTPDLTPTVRQCRKLLYTSAVAAKDAVTACRKERAAAAAEREKERRAEAERNRPARLLELQKKHPANQALWQETAFLLNELSQLAMEEEKWKTARAELDRYEAELLLSSQNSAPTPPETNVVAMNDASDATLDNLKTATREASIAVATMETNLRRVQDAAEKAEASRRQLYETYKSNHQFDGYQDVHNQKGLFKMLSQSQNDDEGMSM